MKKSQCQYKFIQTMISSGSAHPYGLQCFVFRDPIHLYALAAIPNEPRHARQQLSLQRKDSAYSTSVQDPRGFLRRWTP